MGHVLLNGHEVPVVDLVALGSVLLLLLTCYVMNVVEEWHK